MDKIFEQIGISSTNIFSIVRISWFSSRKLQLDEIHVCGTERTGCNEIYQQATELL